MKRPEVPVHEPERLLALQRYGVLDTDPERVFDEIVEIVARVLEVPIAMVSLVDLERQWFKARFGEPASETHRDVSFCAHAVASEALLLVRDAQSDPRFADNPRVTSTPGLRFYVGAPLRTPDGFVLGCLCAMDHVPRSPSQEQVGVLRLLASQVMRHLELRREAHAARQYRRLFDRSNVLPAIVRADGYFASLNPAWERTLGWTEEELKSRPFVEFVHPDDVEVTVAEAARLEAGTETVFFRNRYRCRDGAYRWFEWNVTTDPLEPLFYAFAHDITDQVRVETLKAELVATVSHELRTPLTAIRGSLQLLELGVVGELPLEAGEMVALARSSADRMIRLVNDLLDLDRMDGGRLDLQHQDIDLVAVVSDALEGMRTAAETRGLGLRLESDGPVSAKADRDRIIQVISNLVGNALKFSPSGETVVVRVARSGDRARVEVVDLGRGVPAADLDRIFGRFEQVERGDARKLGGSGLGLAICKAIIDEHAGTIGVASNVGSGATFWFELPGS